VQNSEFYAKCTLAGVAGVLLAAPLLSGSPRAGDVYLLDSIAVVVLGGTALSGGIGGVNRTLIGALIITVIRNGMNVVGLNIFAQQIVLGLILILAVALTMDRTKFPIIK